MRIHNSTKLKKNTKPLEEDDFVTTKPNMQKVVADVPVVIEVMRKINSLMIQHENFEEFCSEVWAQLKSNFKFKYIQIWVKENSNPDVLRLVTPDEVHTSKTTMMISEGIVGQSIRTGTKIVAENVFDFNDYVPTHKDTKSELCIPIICNNEVIGALNIESDITTTFSKQNEVVSMIAENLGYSMKISWMRQGQKYFKTVVEQMNEGLWVGDINERTIYVNSAFAKMIGMSEKEILEKESFELFDESCHEKIRQENIKRKKGIKSQYEAILKKSNGKKIPVILHAAPFEGGTMATIANLDDIVSARKAQKTAEKFLASVAQNSLDAIIGIDMQNHIRSWNYGAQRMYGYDADDVVGKKIEIITPKEFLESGAAQNMLLEASKKGVVKNYESTRIHKNGSKIAVLVTITAIKDEDGSEMGYSILHKNITTEKKWQEEFQGRFEKMQAAYQEMGRQRRYIDYMVEIMEIACDKTRNIAQVTNFIVNAMSLLTKASAITLRKYNIKSKKLHLLAQSGLSDEWIGKKIIPYKGSLVEVAVEQNMPMKILDIINHPKYNSPSLARKRNLCSALVVPLVVRAEIIGSMTIYLSEEKDLSLLDDEFISMFSLQAACALKVCDNEVSK